jgi:hypothetical protein
MTTIIGSNISSFSSLDAAIEQADAETVAGTYEIELASNATIAITAELDAINLAAGVTLDIVGNGATLYGGGTQRGLFVYAGAVSIASVSLDDLLAQGGNGGGGNSGGGGGGGAGLGGGLFVAAAGNVTLDLVSFAADQAKGGNGGTYSRLSSGRSGGGGGMVGNGASGSPGFGGSGIAGADGFGEGGAPYAQAGFGGGGGNVGTGGFGGGGGRYPGFGGGYGADTGGSGGGGGGALGAGGDIFVQQGGSLTIEGGVLATGTVTGGLGAGQAANGSALGGGMFLQGYQTQTLAPTSGQTLTIAGVIADQGGSAHGGAGALDIAGAGTVVLAAVNSFVGGTTLTSGTTKPRRVPAASASPPAARPRCRSATATSRPTPSIILASATPSTLPGSASRPGRLSPPATRWWSATPAGRSPWIWLWRSGPCCNSAPTMPAARI